jgi:hypothetical protein
MIDQIEQKCNHHYCRLIVARESGNDLRFTGINLAEQESCPAWHRQEWKDLLELSNVQSLKIVALEDEVFRLTTVNRSLQEDLDSRF